MMKIGIWIAAIVLIVAVGLYGFMKLPNANENSENEAQKSTYNFESIQNEVSKGSAVLYDVRTPEEFSEGKFSGAINYPLQDLQSGKMPNLDKTGKIYVYCRSGNRSAQATKILKDSGFANVVDLHGLNDVQRIGGKLN